MGNSGKSTSTLSTDNNSNHSSNENNNNNIIIDGSISLELQNMMTNVVKTYNERFENIEENLRKLESKVNHLGDRVSYLHR